MVKRYFAECCISFSRHKISFAESVIMCRIRNVEELKGSFTNDVIGLGRGGIQIMTADDGGGGLPKMT